MDFKNCDLFLKDIYSYDISSCHYTLLQRTGIDISNIPKDDKFKRNMLIGLMIRDNPRIGKMLRTLTESTINEFIFQNKLSEHDIIIRQYDGFITSKKLEVLNINGLFLDLHHFFCYFIISFNRQWYLAIDTNKNIVVKGVPHYYEALNRIYRKILHINYLNKKAIFIALDNIQKEVNTSTETELFCIPINDHEYNIFLKEYGQITISKTMINLIDCNDIDRERYFDYYFKPFTETICYKFL